MLDDFFDGIEINENENKNSTDKTEKNKEEISIEDVNSDIDNIIENLQPQENTENKINRSGNVNNNPTISEDINKPFLPDCGHDFTNKSVIKIEGQKDIYIEHKVPAKPTIKFEQESWEDIDKFEKEAWMPNKTGYKTGFSNIDKALDGGLKAGFYIIAGDSNIGKSAIMAQMAFNLPQLNDNVFVMDFSLDDPKEDRIPRILGSNYKILLNAIKNPNGYKQYPQMIVRRKAALLKLRESVDRYKLYDASDMVYIEDIDEEIKRINIELKSNNINKNIVVFIDNFHDLMLKGKDNLDDKTRYEKLAEKVSDMSIQWGIPIVCTAEFRKLKDPKNNRPEIDDIREAVKIKYRAKCILLLYNQVHYKGENADMYFTRTSSPNKQPVIEVRFAKNKISDFKGTTFFEFFPEMARVEVPSQQSINAYKNILYKQ